MKLTSKIISPIARVEYSRLGLGRRKIRPEIDFQMDSVQVGNSPLSHLYVSMTLSKNAGLDAVLVYTVVL